MRESKKFEELEQTISLTVKTKCPEKYFLVDRETGDIFVGSIMGHWDRFESVTKNF
jgi:hypothetical protein